MIDAVDPHGALCDVVREAHRSGWALIDLTLGSLAESLAELGVPVLPTRGSDGPIGFLRPSSIANAHPRSLSSKYGHSRLPLHTDGAHLPRPPGIVMLSASRPGDGCCTHLFRVEETELPGELLEALRHGVFAVGAARNAFLAHAVDAGRLRFDPGCMRPADPLARYVQSWFADAWDQSIPHSWAADARTLVIDNTRTLHGRPATTQDDDRELRRLMVDWRQHDKSG